PLHTSKPSLQSTHDQALLHLILVEHQLRSHAPRGGRRSIGAISAIALSSHSSKPLIRDRRRTASSSLSYGHEGSRSYCRARGRWLVRGAHAWERSSIPPSFETGTVTVASKLGVDVPRAPCRAFGSNRN